MVRDHRLRLLDMLEYARRAVSILGAVTLDELADDDLRQMALARCLEVIGEAGKNVPAELQSANPQVPFSSAARMRDRLIHTYFAVETKYIYDTVRDDLPAMIETLEALIASMSDGE